MFIRLKATTLAALGTLCFAAGMGGASLADDNVPTVPAIRPVDPPSPSSPPLTGPVAFAALKEVVQPLPGETLQADSEAALPVRKAVSLMALVNSMNVEAPLDEETRCLATAIFYEARSESLEGQLAVARVVINRSKSPRFTGSLCGVVRQPGQFGFVRRGVIPEPNTSRPAWKTSVAVAHVALENAWASEAEGALYFHARRVSPGWSRQRVARIDNHVFYR
jgi:spore germination cell wall hydrolase CwlJ-like protein